MNNVIVAGVGAIGALAVSTLLGAGVASADDYANQSYADASSAASDAGLSVIVASRVGDQFPDDECMVTRSQTAPFASANDGAHVSGVVQFYLNCNRAVASATTPGNSLGSELGRSAKAAEEQAAKEAASSEEQALEDVSKPGA